MLESLTSNSSPDGYIPFVLDRIAVIFGYQVIALIVMFDAIILYQFSSVINLSRSFASRFQLCLGTWVVLTSLPLWIESILFMAKIIDHGSLFVMSRYWLLAGIAPMALYDTTQTFYIAFHLHGLSKLKCVRDDQKMFEKMTFLGMGIIVVDGIGIIVNLLTFVAPYRYMEESHEIAILLRNHEFPTIDVDTLPTFQLQF